MSTLQKLFYRIVLAMSVAALALPVATAGNVGGPEPLIPINTVLTHWDHHWFVWMPKHPTYESIEVMSTDAGADEKPLVWVFLTERAGQKKQVHYLSDQSVAWPGTTVCAISYQRQGAMAGQSVHVALTDKNNVPIDVTVSVDPAAAMSKAGLTDQSGHAAGSMFLMFFRELTQNAVSNRVNIGGVDYSFNSREGLEDKYAFMSAYSSNIFTAIVPYGQAHVAIANGVLSHSRGMTFARRVDQGRIIYQSASVPGRGFVSLEADQNGSLRAYRRVVGTHDMRITFEPALRAPAPGKDTQIKYGISLDHFDNIVSGTLYASEQAGTITLKWQHDQPQWTTGAELTSTIKPDADLAGYLLTVAPSRTAH